ncbi:MAG: hypothetical protein KA761_00285 [Gemmatimonadaceae bacterium]|nr:hypothetical protein [Gemmatimonadaceae bacterium]
MGARFGKTPADRAAKVEAVADAAAARVSRAVVLQASGEFIRTLADDRRMVRNAHVRLARALDNQDPGQVAAAARNLGTLCMMIAGRMEYACGYIAGARDAIACPMVAVPSPLEQPKGRSMYARREADPDSAVLRAIERLTDEEWAEVARRAHRAATVVEQARAGVDPEAARMPVEEDA